MFRSQAETPEIDQEIRRTWAYKARMRDEAKARKRHIIARIVLAVVVIASAIYIFLSRH